MAAGFAFAKGTGFGVLPGLASAALTGLRRALPAFVSLRAGAVFAVSFTCVVDLAARAGLAIREVMLFLVA